jgi:acid stress-induced BolA-like protein IbaG/YrbA
MAPFATTSKLLSALHQHCQPLHQTSAKMNFRTTSQRFAPLVRAMSSEGQVTNELIERMRGKIQDALDAQTVEVADVQGDGRHVEIIVVAKAFEGQSAVNRQRMVYKVSFCIYACII